jgi:hypothetical protein
LTSRGKIYTVIPRSGKTYDNANVYSGFLKTIAKIIICEYCALNMDREREKGRDRSFPH